MQILSFVITFFILLGWLNFMICHFNKPIRPTRQSSQAESNWVWITLKSKSGKEDDSEFDETVKNFINTHHCKCVIPKEVLPHRSINYYEYETSILYKKRRNNYEI